MPDVRDVHNAVRNDLQRRRELARMPKPALVDYIVRVENSLAELTDRIESRVP